MNPIDTLLALASAFADQRKLSESRVSTIVFGDGTRLKHLRQGGDMGARRVDRAIIWFSANWPEALAWPTDIVRPTLPIVDATVGPAAAGDPPPAAAFCVGDVSERPVHVDSS